jgi:hypothetical protein
MSAFLWLMKKRAKMSVFVSGVILFLHIFWVNPVVTARQA